MRLVVGTKTVWEGGERHCCQSTKNFTVPSEIARPAGVDDGVHARVDPSEPSDYGDDPFWVVDARLTESREQIRHEERQPTRDEHAHHDAQRPVYWGSIGNEIFLSIVNF